MKFRSLLPSVRFLVLAIFAALFIAVWHLSSIAPPQAP